MVGYNFISPVEYIRPAHGKSSLLSININAVSACGRKPSGNIPILIPVPARHTSVKRIFTKTIFLSLTISDERFLTPILVNSAVLTCKLLFTCKKRIAVATLSHSHYLLHRYNLACKLSERIDSDFLAGLCCNITIIFFCKLIIHVECVCMLLKCTNLNSVVSCPELNEHIIALGF